MEEINPPAPSQNQSEQMKGKNVGMAIVAYFIFFVPLLTDAKNDPFVKFHVKQGLTLFIAGFIISILSWMPIVRWLNAAIIILLIVGVMNAANGREKPLPLIGRFAEKFNF